MRDDRHIPPVGAPPSSEGLPRRGEGAPAPIQGARYQALDVWRGLACLMIVVHHAGYALHWSDVAEATSLPWLRALVVGAVKNLSLGVPLFFVISGYCILASVEASIRKGASAGNFLLRRFWRIYPPYWAALFGFVVVVAALDAVGLERWHHGAHAVTLDSPATLDLPRWVGNITLTETWRRHAWGPDIRDVYTGVAWSLCYEEQFYFVSFLVLLVMPKRVYSALALTTVAAVGWRVRAWQTDHFAPIAGTFPLLWHQFAVGLAVYYRLNVARTWRARRAVEAGLALLVLVGLVSDERETLVAAAFGLVLIALRPWDAWADGRAWLGPLRACGRRCYSIYLAHLPIGVVGSLALYEYGLTGFWARALVTIPVVSAAGVAVSWVFFATVETRFLAPPALKGRRGALPFSIPGKTFGARA